jgi:phosphinothricin acetyltransferase
LIEDALGFTIRLAEPDDAAFIAAIYGPIVESTPISFETDPPSAAEMARRIEQTLRFHPWLVGEYDGRVVGYAYAAGHRIRAAYRWSVDTSVYVDAAFRRRRIGLALYTSLLRILAAQGHFNAYAGIALPNPASVAVHESAGFRPVGIYRNVGYKLGEWHDVGWWQLELQPHRPSPLPPIGIDVLRQGPSWRTLVEAGVSVARINPDDVSAT